MDLDYPKTNRCSWLSSDLSWSAILVLAIFLSHCSSQNEDGSIEEYVQKADSESFATEQDSCRSGIGVLLNFDAPTPPRIEVFWETADFPRASIYSDCSYDEARDVNFVKKDFSIYLEDRRYGRIVADRYAMQMLNCETGRILVDMPTQNLQKNLQDICHFYLNVFDISSDFYLKSR